MMEAVKIAACVILGAGCIAAMAVHLWEERRNRATLPVVRFPIRLRQEDGVWVARSKVSLWPILSAATFEQLRREALKEGPRLAVFYGAAVFGQRVRVLLDVAV